MQAPERDDGIPDDLVEHARMLMYGLSDLAVERRQERFHCLHVLSGFAKTGEAAKVGDHHVTIFGVGGNQRFGIKAWRVGEFRAEVKGVPTVLRVMIHAWTSHRTAASSP